MHIISFLCMTFYLGVILLLFGTEAGAATLSSHQHLQSICENRQLSIPLEETE